jgi:hypothetical protein
MCTYMYTVEETLLQLQLQDEFEWNEIQIKKGKIQNDWQVNTNLCIKIWM